MSDIQGSHHVQSAVLLYLLLGCVAALDADQRTGLIVGCSIGGAILFIVVVVLLVYCCKSSKDEKERKKKKSQYLQYEDPTSVRPSHHHPDAYYKAVNGHANGHAGQHKSVPKLGRSLSDVQPSRASYVMPEWRKNHERVESGSQLSGYDNRSDISAGIWTSNPTLTRGVYPGHVIGTNGVQVPNGRSKQPHGSEPAIAAKTKHDKKKNKPKRGHNNNNLLLAVDEETMFSGVVDGRHKAHGKVVAKSDKKDRVDVTEDRTKLIPASGKENSRHAEPQTLVKVYSNPNVSVTDSPAAQHGPFVAKVYSDYQRPRDFLSESQPNTQTRSKVVKAYSAHTKDERPRVVASQTDIRPGDRHIAKVVVGDNNNYLSWSNGDYSEPYRGQAMTQSDMFIHRAAESRVVRSQSNMERSRAPDQLHTAHQMQAKRSASHVVRQVPNKPGNQERGVQKLAVSHSQVQKHRDDKKQSKTTENKEAKRRKKEKKESPVISVGDQRDKRASTGAPNQRIASQQTPASKPRRDQPDIHIMPAVYQQEPPVILNEPPRPEHESPPPNRRISESSSVPRTPEPVASSSVGTQQKVTQADIYATPLKRASRPVSDVVVVEVNTAASPDPPPVPPVTSLRQEAPTPTSLRQEASTPTSSGRRNFSSSASDGDGLSTGKNVIGDAFQFLDDFDDNISYDGGPEKF